MGRCRVGVLAHGGQHNEPAALAYDAARTRRLAAIGVRVVQFSDYDVLKYAVEVAAAIYREVTERPGPPSPRPSPGVPGEGEGGRPRGGPGAGETLQIRPRLP